MLFTSFSFLLFFAIFWILYRRTSFQAKRLVMTASLIFYGAWNIYFLFLMLFTAAVDFWCGLKIAKSPAQKKLFLSISIAANLSILGFFKYGGFAGRMVNDFLGFLGVPLEMTVLAVILPVGLSFYTFQEMAYTIDVYRGRIEPAKNFLDFLTYVSFFPQLIAGPIMRPGVLLPQILRLEELRREINADRVALGITLLLRGFIKKTLIADHLSSYVDQVYASLHLYGMATIVVATCFFALQIYCDFSGYTDIARGLGRLLGVELMENFNYPYFSANIKDFWSRWHISLSSWIRDYLYIPLGGNRHGMVPTIRNIFLAMLLCGLWHGANYTFLLWGMYHGLLLILYLLWRCSALSRLRIPSVACIGATFGSVLFGWFLFRVSSIDDILMLPGRFASPASHTQIIPDLNLMLLAGGLVMWQAIECRILRRRVTLLEIPNRIVRGAVAASVAVACFLGKPATDKVFIYFQF